MRVLLIAESANPEWVSVPLVGWSLARAISRQVDAHIVTQVRNRAAFARAGLVEGRDFTAIDSEALMRPVWAIAQRLSGGQGVGWTAITALQSLAYPYFERLVWKRFGSEVRAGRFDIVHRITPLTPTAASSLAKRCAESGVPFVLGPLNGGLPWPQGFDQVRRAEREWLSYVRGAYKLLPGWRSTFTRATAVIVGSRHTARELPSACRSRCVYMPENGIDPSRFTRSAQQSQQGPLKVVFIGRLVPYKGLDMVLEAAAELLASGKATLDVVGDGPQMQPSREWAARSGVSQAVVFHGWLAHERVQDVLATSHVLAFPSIREFGGGVVLEAMATGVIPVVVDYGGPGELVADAVGVKIPLSDRAGTVQALREALWRLAGPSRANLPAMAASARNMVDERFTWEAKARQIVEWYAEWTARPRTQGQG